jgi:hypothetical protein
VTATEFNIAEFSTSTNVLQSNTGGTGARLRASVSSAAFPTFAFSNDDNTGIFWAAADTLGFSTGGSERLRIDSSGNVGIGDTNPANGYLTIRGASTSGTINSHIMLTGDGATVGEGPQIVFSESGGASNWVGASIGFERTGLGGIGNFIFRTRRSTGDATTLATEAMRIDSNGDISFYEDTGTTAKFFWDASAESLGIGTSSPSTTLDLVGNWVSNTGQLSIDTPSGETYSGLAILNNGAIKGFLYHDNSAGTLDLQTYTTDALRFKTNNTERMRIDSSGNVGWDGIANV